MCGITGAFRISGGDSAPLPEYVLRRMAAQIEYRGPDDAGFVSGAGCSLGARRLSIIDVEGGHQPFANESGRIWAAQNGEIYNHAALRAELESRGHRLRSRCDTEVLPHLYEEHGPELSERLRGMFAVRGLGPGSPPRRAGARPAGDQAALLRRGRGPGRLRLGAQVPDRQRARGRELDPEAIAAYLTLGFVPSPLTPLRQVRKLNPGERLVVEDGRVRVERWWRYPAPEPQAEPSLSEAEWSELLLARLEESVRMRLMSDVPLGAMLSGGLDSSLIVALMAGMMDRPVQTFAVGFAGEDSELPDARRVAEFCGAEHHELEVDLTSDPETLSRLTWHLDEPLADLSSLGFLALSELAPAT